MRQDDHARAVMHELGHALSDRAMGLFPWDPAKSDGCSIPSWVRWLLPKETTAQRACCLKHDEAYYYGGTIIQRYQADLGLYQGLVAAGMPRWRATFYFYGARIFGAPLWPYNDRRWSWGAGYFRYEPR